MEHKIYAYRGFAPEGRGKWFCICGTLMESEVFGLPLEKEFRNHVKEAS